MNDTSKQIQQEQLKIWLAKSPAERLRQMLADNEALWKFWNTAKKVASSKTPLINTTPAN